MIRNVLISFGTNNALHRTAIPLHSIAAGELCPCASYNAARTFGNQLARL